MRDFIEENRHTDRNSKFVTFKGIRYNIPDDWDAMHDAVTGSVNGLRLIVARFLKEGIASAICDAMCVPLTLNHYVPEGIEPLSS